ncbi:MAG: hypothetical protein MUF48_11570 [Pirellulaceae bacterium]|jgi:hypothetical protein|nr:hypothetical protein [Pirellulaceae bacterium]
MRTSHVLLLVALGAAGEADLLGAEWGDLKGRFVYDGTPPAAAKLNITTDKEFCELHNLKSESLVVHPENKGVQNVIVYLYQNKSGVQRTPYDEQEVPIHESYLPLEQQVVQLDNSKCRFEPHVALVWTRQAVLLANSDPIGHNVKIDCSRENGPSNDTLPSGGSLERRFTHAERFPVPVSCSIHPWMKGWVVIRDTPYLAVTDANGAFELKNLPAGKWQFMFWHETAGYVSKVKVQGKAEEWKRGIATFTIQPGKQDLGDILLSPELFK